MGEGVRSQVGCCTKDRLRFNSKMQIMFAEGRIRFSSKIWSMFAVRRIDLILKIQIQVAENFCVWGCTNSRNYRNKFKGNSNLDFNQMKVLVESKKRRRVACSFHSPDSAKNPILVNFVFYFKYLETQLKLPKRCFSSCMQTG